MDFPLHVGCCGWSYLSAKKFAELLPKNYSTKLQAYAQLYDVVEINSSYYAIPKIATAQKWQRESRAINARFEFTVKAFQGITHYNRFGLKAEHYYTQMVPVCEAAGARILLFQSPANFHPTPDNINRLKGFFTRMDRSGLLFAWEPRGQWYDRPEMIAGLCEQLELIHCVDPFRNEPLAFGSAGIAYFRLHGFGKPNMYNYEFTEKELRDLQQKIGRLPGSVREVYVMFNNAYCYENAAQFARMNLLVGQHRG